MTFPKPKHGCDLPWDKGSLGSNSGRLTISWDRDEPPGRFKIIVDSYYDRESKPSIMLFWKESPSGPAIRGDPKSQWQTHSRGDGLIDIYAWLREYRHPLYRER
jgi:hypothetical protein